MMAPNDRIKLWWPNGMGAEPLYNSRVTIVPLQQQKQQQTLMQEVKRGRLLRGANGAQTQWMNERIGFRTTAIVTVNETDVQDPTSSRSHTNDTENHNKQEEGTGLHGMYFCVNGALVMARGANVIPADQLEGRYISYAAIAWTAQAE